MFDKIQAMHKLMKDENFRAFVSHPKVQTLFRDPEFKDVAKSRDFAKIAMHPKFVQLAQDPDVSKLLLKINPRDFQV